MPKSRFNEVRAQCPLGMRWLWFYARVFLLIEIIGLGIDIIFDLIKWIGLVASSGFFDMDAISKIIVICSRAACLWLCGTAYFGILNFTERGYKYNKIFLCVLTPVMLLSYWINQDIPSWPYMLGTLAFAGVWLVANLRYFAKRKHLFVFQSADPMGSTPKSSVFATVRMQSTLGTRWLWFYTRVFLLLEIILVGFALIFGCEHVVRLVLSPENDTVYVLASVLYNAICLWLSINAYIGILGFRESGYKYNQAFLYVLTVGGIAIQCIGEAPVLPFFIGSIVVAVVWLIPNLIYFKKRKSLFGSPAVDAEIHEIPA